MSVLFVLVNLFFLISNIVPSKCEKNDEKAPDFYTFEVDDIEGSSVSLERYRGKVKKTGSVMHVKVSKSGIIFSRSHWW